MTMLRPGLLALCLVLSALSARAGEVDVAPGPGALAAAIAGASPGDVLQLLPGTHDGGVVVDRALTLQGKPGAIVDGGGRGSVVTVTAPDVTVRGLTITGSGGDNKAIDSGVKAVKGTSRVVVEGNRLTDNMHGVDMHGCIDCTVRGNVIEGRQAHRMLERGNGVYVWNAPGLVVEDNDIRWGRDGIFSNTSKKDVIRNNRFRDLRFGVHFMYTNDSEVSGNVSAGNHLGYAIMFSNRVRVLDNLSLNDRDHGVMLNAANSGDVAGNLVRGGTKKCLFVYDANKGLIANNRFEGCGIGIHFTAGSERNAITGNGFIGNRTQVKYVGTRDVQWSLEGRGNFWSDLPAFDLNGDGLADSPFRPNDLMDHILWSQPAAALLMGAPAVQLIRWSQQNFPATLPGGVVDSFPLMTAPDIAVPADILAIERESLGRWSGVANYEADEDADNLMSH